MSLEDLQEMSGEAVIERITKEIEELENHKLSFYTDMSQLINAPMDEQATYEEKKQAAAANIQKYFCGSKSAADSAEVAARLEELLAHLKSGSYQNSEVLSDQIANLNRTLDAKKLKIQNLEQSEQAAQKSLQAVQHSHDELKSRYEEKAAAVEKFKITIAKWAASHRRLEENNRELASAKESSLHAMDQAINNLNALREKNNELTRQLEAERLRATELDRKATLSQANSTARQSEIQDLQNRLKTSEVSLRTSETSLRASETSLRTSEASLSSAKMQLATSEQKVAMLEEKMRHIEKRGDDANKLEIRSSVLESENSAYKAKIAELEKQLMTRDAASTQHMGLELKLNEANIKNEALEKKVSELNEKIKEDAALVATLHREESASGASATRVQLLEAQLANLKTMHEKEIADLKERAKESGKTCEHELDSHVAALKEELRETKAHHADKVKTFSAQIAALEKDLAAARSPDIYTQKEARIKQLETELQEAKNRIRDLEHALRKVESLLR